MRKRDKFKTKLKPSRGLFCPMHKREALQLYSSPFEIILHYPTCPSIYYHPWTKEKAVIGLEPRLSMFPLWPNFESFGSS